MEKIRIRDGKIRINIPDPQHCQKRFAYQSVWSAGESRVGNYTSLLFLTNCFFLTCDDNLGGLLGQDPVEEGPEVPVSEAVGDPQQVSGQHDDKPGEESVHHNVSRPEGEQEGRLERLSHLCCIHGVFL